MVEYELKHDTEQRVTVHLRDDLSEGTPMRRLQRRMQRLCREGTADELVIDVSGLSFNDVHGLAMLLSLHGECRNEGRRLIVSGAHGQVRDKLRMAGLLEFLGS